MFESRHEPLLTQKQFRKRVLYSIMLALLLVLFMDGLGTLGYCYFANLPLIDAFLEASMILSGMGPVSTFTTSSAKIFAAFYALFSGVAFVSSIGVIFIPIVHRFLHRFHLDSEE